MSSPRAATDTLPDAGSRLDRINSASTRDTLERIGTPELLAAGGINLIGLEAIREQLGQRWERKAPSIWEHLERELERTVGAAGVFNRLDDITYLVALPGEEGLVAQAICLTVLQDVLKFFLGDARLAENAVRTVTRFEAGAISSAPVDPTRLRRRIQPGEGGADIVTEARPGQAAEPAATTESSAGPLGEQAPPPKPWKPPLAGRRFNLELETAKRERFDLRFQVEPVWNLKRGLITSFLIDRTGGPSRAEASDLEEMDIATLAYVSTLMAEHASQGGPLVLHVPIHFTTLATQRSRERMIRMTRQVREAMRSVLLLEIDGLDAGVPPSRLLEVVGLMRSLCAGVLGRARPTKAAFEAVRGCGLRGVVASAAQLGLTADGAAGRLKAYAAFARDLAPNALIHGLPAPEMVDDAAAAGFTHASVAPGPA